MAEGQQMYLGRQKVFRVYLWEELFKEKGLDGVTRTHTHPHKKTDEGVIAYEASSDTLCVCVCVCMF